MIQNVSIIQALKQLVFKHRIQVNQEKPHQSSMVAYWLSFALSLASSAWFGEVSTGVADTEAAAKVVKNILRIYMVKNASFFSW